MNWLARYRDNYEQETKDLIADLEQSLKKVEEAHLKDVEVHV